MAKKNGRAVVIKAPTETTRRVTTKTEGAVTYYTNAASFQVSNFDVKILFGEIESASPELLETRVLANIYMSHSHFRAFIDAMHVAAGNIATLMATPKTDSSD